MSDIQVIFEHSIFHPFRIYIKLHNSGAHMQSNENLENITFWESKGKTDNSRNSHIREAKWLRDMLRNLAVI